MGRASPRARATVSRCPRLKAVEARLGLDLVDGWRSPAYFNKVYGPACTLSDNDSQDTSYAVGLLHYEWRPNLAAARKDTEETLETGKRVGYDDFEVFAAPEFGKRAFGYYQSIEDTSECSYYFRHRIGRLFEASVAFWKGAPGQGRTCALAHRWTGMLF